MTSPTNTIEYYVEQLVVAYLNLSTALAPYQILTFAEGAEILSTPYIAVKAKQDKLISFSCNRGLKHYYVNVVIDSVFLLGHETPELRTQIEAAIDAAIETPTSAPASQYLAPFTYLKTIIGSQTLNLDVSASGDPRKPDNHIHRMRLFKFLACIE